MTRAQIIAVAAALSALTAGTIVFLTSDADTGIDGTLTAPAMFQMLDRSQCTPSACNAPACNLAKAVLLDAGQPCTVGFANCSARIGPIARAFAADAGVLLPPSLYQRLGFIAMRCTVPGGFTYGVPVNDAGWPLFGVQVMTPLCVRAPLDGGNTCLRAGGELDGGNRFFGTGNVFPAGQAAGSNCEPVECTVLAGEDPDVSL